MCFPGHTIDLFFTTHVIKFISLASLSIPQVIPLKHNFSMKIKKSSVAYQNVSNLFQVKSNGRFLGTFGVKTDVKNTAKMCRASTLGECRYLSIKDPKASRALKQALDNGRRMLASLARLRFANVGNFRPQMLGPHLTKS